MSLGNGSKIKSEVGPGAITGINLSVPSQVTEGDVVPFQITINTTGQVIVNKVEVEVGIPQPGGKPFTKVFEYEPPGGIYTSSSGSTTITVDLPFGLPLSYHERTLYQKTTLPNIPIRATVYYDDGSGTMKQISTIQYASVTVMPTCIAPPIFTSPLGLVVSGAGCAAVTVGLTYLMEFLPIAAAAAQAPPYTISRYPVPSYGSFMQAQIATNNVYAYAIRNYVDDILRGLEQQFIDVQLVNDLAPDLSQYIARLGGWVSPNTAPIRAMYDGLIKYWIYQDLAQQYGIPMLENVPRDFIMSDLANRLGPQYAQELDSIAKQTADAIVNSFNIPFNQTPLETSFQQVFGSQIMSDPYIANGLRFIDNYLGNAWSWAWSTAEKQLIPPNLPYQISTTPPPTPGDALSDYVDLLKSIQQPLVNTGVVGPQSTTNEAPPYEIEEMGVSQSTPQGTLTPTSDQTAQQITQQTLGNPDWMQQAYNALKQYISGFFDYLSTNYPEIWKYIGGGIENAFDPDGVFMNSLIKKAAAAGSDFVTAAYSDVKTVADTMYNLYNLYYYANLYIDYNNAITSQFDGNIPSNVNNALQDLYNSITKAIDDANSALSALPGSPQIDPNKLVNTPNSVISQIGYSIGSGDVDTVIPTLNTLNAALQSDLDDIAAKLTNLYNIMQSLASQGVSQAQAVQNTVDNVLQNTLPPRNVPRINSSMSRYLKWFDFSSDLIKGIFDAVAVLQCLDSAISGSTLVKLGAPIVKVISSTPSSIFSLVTNIKSKIDAVNYGTYTLVKNLSASIPIEYLVYLSQAVPYIKGYDKIYKIINKGWAWLYNMFGTAFTYINNFFNYLASHYTMQCGSWWSWVCEPSQNPSPQNIVPSLPSSCVMPSEAKVVVNGTQVAYAYIGVPITSSVLNAIFNNQVSTQALTFSMSVSGVGVVNPTPGTTTGSTTATAAIRALSASSSSSLPVSIMIIGGYLEATVNGTQVMMIFPSHMLIGGSSTASFSLTGLSVYNTNNVAFTTYTANIDYNISIPIAEGSQNLCNADSSVMSYVEIKGYMLSLPVSMAFTQPYQPIEAVDAKIPIGASQINCTQSQIGLNVTATPSSGTAYVASYPVSGEVSLYDTSGKPLTITVTATINTSGQTGISREACANLGGYVSGNNCVIPNQTASTQITVAPNAILPSSASWVGCSNNVLSDGRYNTNMLSNLIACADLSTGNITLQVPNVGYDGVVTYTIYASNVTCSSPQSIVLPSGETVSACPALNGSAYVPGVPPLMQGAAAYIKTLTISLPSPLLNNIASAGGSLYAQLTDNNGNTVIVPIQWNMGGVVNLTLLCESLVNAVVTNGVVMNITESTITTNNSGVALIAKAYIKNKLPIGIPVSFTASLYIAGTSYNVTSYCTYGNTANSATTPCTQPITLAPGKAYELTFAINLVSAAQALDIPLSELSTSSQISIGATTPQSALGTCSAPITQPPCFIPLLGQYMSSAPVPGFVCPKAWSHPTCYVISTSTTNNGVPVLTPGQTAYVKCIVPNVQFPIATRLYAVPMNYSIIEDKLNDYDALNNAFTGNISRGVEYTLNNGNGTNIQIEIGFTAPSTPGTYTIAVGFVAVPIFPQATGAIKALQASTTGAYVVDVATATYEVQSTSTSSPPPIYIGGYITTTSSTTTPTSNTSTTCPTSGQLAVNPQSISKQVPQGGSANMSFTITNGSQFDLSITCNYTDPFTNQAVNIGSASVQPTGSATFTMTVPVPSNAQPGTYNVPVTCTVTNQDLNTQCGYAPAPSVTLTVISASSTQSQPPSGSNVISGYANIQVTCQGIDSGYAVCPSGTVTITCNVTNPLSYPVELNAEVFDASGVPVASLSQPFIANPGASSFNVQFQAPNIIGAFNYLLLVYPYSETPPSSLTNCQQYNGNYYLCTQFQVAVSNATCVTPTGQQPPQAQVISLSQVMQSVTQLTVVAALFAMIAAMIRTLKFRQ